MADWIEFSAKTVEDALTEALQSFGMSSDKVEYEVLEKETKGFFGINSKPGKIRARLKYTVDGAAREFLTNVFRAMNLDAQPVVTYKEEEELVEIDITGDEMGVLIGKRGQTLDSLQYLTSLVLNKDSETYIKVKLDTENYRERRKETLENLAKNIAIKVKRTRKPVVLEPMNPYERRIIHSALQNDKFVETHSEGEEPFRKVVVTLKKNAFLANNHAGGNKYGKYGSNYKKNNGGYKKDYRRNYSDKKRSEGESKKESPVEASEE